MVGNDKASNNEECPDFGALVLKHRKKARLSQQAAAGLAGGYDNNWWWRIEKGETHPGKLERTMVEKIAEICKCSDLDSYELFDAYSCYREKFLELVIELRDRESREAQRELEETRRFRIWRSKKN